jgi:hypothetical protein
MPVKIRIDPNQVGQKVMTAWKDGLAALSEEILADCNEYCKEDQHTLIDSSLAASIPSEGKLIWETPYAKRQYWAIKTSLTPGRTWKWCETAKRKHKERWKRLAERGLRENL